MDNRNGSTDSQIKKLLFMAKKQETFPSNKQ